jgi:hypothetical protein
MGTVVEIKRLRVMGHQHESFKSSGSGLKLVKTIKGGYVVRGSFLMPTSGETVMVRERGATKRATVEIKPLSEKSQLNL